MVVLLIEKGREARRRRGVRGKDDQPRVIYAGAESGTRGPVGGNL